jgi:hypothetical protein
MYNIAQIVKQESLSCTTTVPEFSLGTKTYDGCNEYVYVYNAAANSKILTGQYACIDVNGGTSATSGFSVSVSNASLGGIFAGCAQNTFLTGTYGFLMTKGVSLIALDSGEVSINAGINLCLGTDGGWVSAYATLSTAPRYGVALNSLITAATGKGRIYGSVL